MTGHRPFGKICYESERKRENWRRENAKFGKLRICMYVEYNSREGIIEDLIAQHDF